MSPGIPVHSAGEQSGLADHDTHVVQVLAGEEESFSILCALGKYLGVEKWPGWVTETDLLAFLPQKIWQQWHHQMGLLQVSAS